MSLDQLRVIHHQKAASLNGVIPGMDTIPGAFHLDTCQRVLWICSIGDLQESLDAGIWSGFSVLAGVEAYAFLLRVATGLESQVIGETDVFGQLKEAWRKAVPLLNEDVNFWIQKIFEDTKEVRSRHLQHLGGVSYGTLVRKFLVEADRVRYAYKDRVTRGPTLLVGAGQLAQSVGPFLQEQEIWIQNRSVKNARALAVELEQKYSARVRVLETTEDEAEGWKVAARAIVCIPVDEACDGLRAELWKSGNALAGETRTLLHLGAQKAQSGDWQSVAGTYFLDDLFELQRAQGEVRSFQIGLALRACEERAKLRALGNSVSIHHGWEDLAVFA